MNFKVYHLLVVANKSKNSERLKVMVIVCSEVPVYYLKDQWDIIVGITILEFKFEKFFTKHICSLHSTQPDIRDYLVTTLLFLCNI